MKDYILFKRKFWMIFYAAYLVAMVGCNGCSKSEQILVQNQPTTSGNLTGEIIAKIGEFSITSSDLSEEARGEHVDAHDLFMSLISGYMCRQFAIENNLSVPNEFLSSYVASYGRMNSPKALIARNQRLVETKKLVIIGLRQVYESNQTPDEVYRTLIKGNLARGSWTVVVDRVKRDGHGGLAREIERLESIIAEDKAEIVAAEASIANSRSSYGPDTKVILDDETRDFLLGSYSARMLLEKYGSGAETEAKAYINYARHLKDKGLFEIYDTKYRDLFWDTDSDSESIKPQ